MPEGTLQVLLLSAKGLNNTDLISNIDPYAILTCRSQERKSSVASGKGSNPEWNETFVFNFSSGISELKIKIMDRDSFTEDDFIGQAIIPFEPLFAEGSVPPKSYNIVKDQQFCGEIKVGLTFTRQRSYDRGFHELEESFGGWKDSCID